MRPAINIAEAEVEIIPGKSTRVIGKRAPEKKIEFEFVQQGRDYLIVSVR